MNVTVTVMRNLFSRCESRDQREDWEIRLEVLEIMYAKLYDY